jgi:hypothetical protein
VLRVPLQARLLRQNLHHLRQLSFRKV